MDTPGQSLQPLHSAAPAPQPSSREAVIARQREIIAELRGLGDPASLLMAAEMLKILEDCADRDEHMHDQANRISALWRGESTRRRLQL